MQALPFVQPKAIGAAEVRSLASLGKGDHGRIVGVLEVGALGERLLEMGLTPGTEIRLVRRSLFGNVLEVALRGYHLSLRRDTAAQILVGPA